MGALESGLCRHVLLTYAHSGDSMLCVLDEISGEEAPFGLFGATGGYALAARRAMHEFHTGPDTWKHIAVGQRKWAQLNPRAILGDRPLTLRDYEDSPFLVEPFRLADNCLLNDGGRACILTSLERARDLRHPPVTIMGLGQHNPSGDLYQPAHLTGPTGAKRASAQAFAMAGIALEDIDACQIYDCFTCTVEITLQDYGFFKPGQGAEWFAGGTIEPGGRMPVNTSGGQLAEAYHMGLTPLTEAVMQLMGRCGARQLGPATGTRKPEVILCSDNGGVLQTHTCCILRRWTS